MPKVDIRPLSDLPEVLPRLASAMSMSRAHMVIDQLKSLVGQSRCDELVFVTCDPIDRNDPGGDAKATERVEPGETRQAGVVVYHPRNADFATVLLAGWSTRGENDEPNQLAERLRILSTARAIGDVLDPLLYQQGVRFLQFATDVLDSPHLPHETDQNLTSIEFASAWQRGLGFTHIGDLEYQSGSIDKVMDQFAGDEPLRIDLRPVTEMVEFSQLVGRTYLETMDCPAMATFRTAEQTLSGYRQSDAFNPKLWFSLHRPHDKAVGSEAVGCLVMGTHKNRQASAKKVGSLETSEPTLTPPIETDEANVISELVYMGLVPEARGSGLGKDVIQQAARVSKQVGAQRMILAVDESNPPARNLYRRAGMKRIMRESVWGKLLSP